MTPEQRAKLPAYARQRLEQLEAEVSELRGLLDVDGEADTVTSDGRRLGHGVVVRWTIGGRRYEVGPARRNVPGDLQVWALDGGPLAALGSVSNVLGIAVYDEEAQRG